MKSWPSRSTTSTCWDKTPSPGSTRRKISNPSQGRWRFASGFLLRQAYNSVRTGSLLAAAMRNGNNERSEGRSRNDLGVIAMKRACLLLVAALGLLLGPVSQRAEAFHGHHGGGFGHHGGWGHFGGGGGYRHWGGGWGGGY